LLASRLLVGLRVGAGWLPRSGELLEELEPELVPEFEPAPGPGFVGLLPVFLEPSRTLARIFEAGSGGGPEGFFA